MSQPDADALFYWEWWKHEENLVTNRGSFFLVGQSMLFAGVGALRAAPDPKPVCAALQVFYGLGIFIALVWLCIGVGNYTLTRKPLRDKVNEFESRHATIRSGKHRCALYSSNFWMATFIPAGIIVAWVCLAFV